MPIRLTESAHVPIESIKGGGSRKESWPPGAQDTAVGPIVRHLRRL